MAPSLYRRYFLGLIIFLTINQIAKANGGNPVKKFTVSHFEIAMLADTVPPPADKATGATGTTTPATTDQPVTNVIKEVPKARKQTAPVPVTIQVKPIQVVKPKIIKPVIKVLR